MVSLDWVPSRYTFLSGLHSPPTKNPLKPKTQLCHFIFESQVGYKTSPTQIPVVSETFLIQSPRGSPPTRRNRVQETWSRQFTPSVRRPLRPLLRPLGRTFPGGREVGLTYVILTEHEMTLWVRVGRGRV